MGISIREYPIQPLVHTTLFQKLAMTSIIHGRFCWDTHIVLEDMGADIR